MPRENSYLVIICKILEGKSEKLANIVESVTVAEQGALAQKAWVLLVRNRESVWKAWRK